MATLCRAQNISEGWVMGMGHLMGVGGSDSNLIIEIESDWQVQAVHQTLDEFLLGCYPGGAATIEKVADTIFPDAFYRGEPGGAARDRLYRLQRLAASVEQRFVGGSYFDRLIDWPLTPSGSTGPQTRNQLEHRIKRLRSEWSRGKRTINLAELGVSSGLEEDEIIESESMTAELRVQHPALDNNQIGFPCLSHISLTVHRGKLDCTAIYRNQHFISKAYGNFVGLMRLMRFVCAEVGCAMGSLVCIATHADAEMRLKHASKDAKRLVSECVDLLEKPSAIGSGGVG